MIALEAHLKDSFTLAGSAIDAMSFCKNFAYWKSPINRHQVANDRGTVYLTLVFLPYSKQENLIPVRFPITHGRFILPGARTADPQRILHHSYLGISSVWFDQLLALSTLKGKVSALSILFQKLSPHNH